MPERDQVTQPEPGQKDRLSQPVPAPESPTRFELRVTADSHLAWLRTRMSVERTLMSWVRTATALIGFGFTIVQFFEHIRQMSDVKGAVRPEAPRYLGLALIAAGIVVLAISSWQYRKVLRYLWSKQFAAVAGIGEAEARTPLIAVTVGLIVVGLFAFGTVFLRIV